MPTIYKTEREVFAALKAKFAPPKYAILPGVADGTGSNKRRTIDALVMSLWPSRGLTLDAIEIKVSRSDLLRELKDPAKAEAIAGFCDRFWLAVGDASIVREGDVPTGWGLLAPGRAGVMTVVKNAPTREDVKPMSRTFLAAILREASESCNAPELRAELLAEARADVEEEVQRLRANQLTHHYKQEFERLKTVAELVREFELRAGVNFNEWHKPAIEQAADIVKAIREGGVEGMLQTTVRNLERTHEAASRTVELCGKMLAKIVSIEGSGSESDQ